MNNSVNDTGNYLERINKVFMQNGIIVEELEPQEPINVDSLTTMSLLVGFEEEFGFDLTEEELLYIPDTYEGMKNLVLQNIPQNAEYNLVYTGPMNHKNNE